MKNALFTVFALFLIYSPLLAQEKTPLFEASDRMKITFYTDLRALTRDKGEDRDEHEARMEFALPEGETGTQEIKLKTRGNFRRSSGSCTFPPIRVNVKKGAVDNTAFHGLDKIKLVTQCRSRELVYKEYLAYRIYNEITDNSFRVRLAEITFQDTKKAKRKKEMLGFFIEPDNVLGDRLGGEDREIRNFTEDRVDEETIIALSMFQYLIGNTDWSLAALHNMVLFLKPDGSKPIPVPYDFDWSGLVGAPYAKPDPKLGITSVKQRLYRGFCRPAEDYSDIIQKFNDEKSDIYAIVDEFTDLKSREKKRILSYLDEFYEVINNPDTFREEVLENCRRS